MGQKKPGPLKRFCSFFWKTSVSSMETTVDMTSKAVEAAGDMTVKAVETAGEMTGKAVGAVGDAASAVGDMTGKAVEVVGDGIKGAINTMLNTGRFLTDSDYRRDVGYPWIRSMLRDNWEKIGKEIGESKEMMKILWKYSHGKEVSDEEAKAAKEQLYDIMRVVPALGIFALPGGAILLPLLARALPWDMMPSSFRDEVTEEYGEDALNGELKPDEEVPTDEKATAPEDLAKTAKKIVETSGEKLEEKQQLQEGDEQS